MHFLRRSAQSLALALIGALVSGACGAPPPKSPAAGLPTFSAEDANLLDDSFSGHLFETAFVPGVAGDDPHFDERVLAAEQIWVLKVATVSREGSMGDNRRYALSFRTLGTLLGPAPTVPVSLSVSAKDPAFHWLDRMGGGWVGTEVVLMVRHYGAGDRIVLHFHGEPNTAQLQARINRIRQAPGPQK